MEEKHYILKSQKNDVLSAIQKVGLDVSQFQWVECPSLITPNLMVSKLIHTATGYYFMFDFRNSRHWSKFSPAVESSEGLEYPGAWMEQMGYVYTWLRCLRTELDTSDLWAAITKERTLFEIASAQDTANMIFSINEQEYIATQLEEIRRYLVKMLEPSREHVQFVTTSLNYLIDASKRQGRKDWYYQAIGVLFTLADGVCLAPDQARELLRLAGQSLDTLFGGMLHLP